MNDSLGRYGANRMLTGACGCCHTIVARHAPQVVSLSMPGAVYHRECFEGWYFGRYGVRPILKSAGERHRFTVVDADAERKAP